MEKWTSILLVSSLLFSIAGTITSTNEVSAKNNTTVETAATAKKTIFLGVTGGESIKEIKKIAKINKWKIDNDLSIASKEGYANLAYKKVKIFGYYSTLYFTFTDNKLKGVQYWIEHEENIEQSEVKAYHDVLYKKIKKDLGNKKGKTKIEKSFAGSMEKPFKARTSEWSLGKSKIFFNTLYNHQSISILLDKDKPPLDITG